MSPKSKLFTRFWKAINVEAIFGFVGGDILFHRSATLMENVHCQATSC